MEITLQQDSPPPHMFRMFPCDAVGHSCLCLRALAHRGAGVVGIPRGTCASLCVQEAGEGSFTAATLYHKSFGLSNTPPVSMMC